MQLQEKSDRLLTVDKETAENNAQEEIDRSSLKALDLMEKLYLMKMLSLEKSPPKQGNPVTLLTTGCNTAIENLSTFIITQLKLVACTDIY